MIIDEKTIEYIAELSKIELSREQSALMVDELGKILEYMDILKAVDTTGVEPLSHVFPVTNIVRDDVVHSHFDRALLLENAPDKSDEFFIVPKAVDA